MMNGISHGKNDVFLGFSSQFTEQPIDFRKIGRNYFMAGNDLWELQSKIRRDVFSIGLFLGEERQGFRPSPAAVEIISAMPDAGRRIMINDKAEWLFVCGRNVLEESITSNPLKLDSGAVLVQNSRNENLGYGVFRKEGESLVVRNMLDKGNYLRANERGRKKSVN